MLRTCATLWLVASISGCALAHEREAVHPTPSVDAAVADAPFVFVDALVVPDTSMAPDAGACTDFWRSLPSCPASTEREIGQPCTDEGATCGVRCCEPGPAIVCTGGRWAETTSDPTCAADCALITPCGDGFCAPGRVCVRNDGEIASATPSCVLPPAPITSCAAAPAGALGTAPGLCVSCSCRDFGSGPVVTLSCDCCDL